MSSGRICVAGALLAILTLAAVAQTNPPAQTKPTTNKPAGKSATPTPKPRKRVAIDLSGFDLLEPKAVTKQTVVPGATRSMPEPVALAPKLARLYGGAPVLAWEYNGNVDAFTFVLRDDASNEVFRDDAKGHSYAYPATAPKLVPGRTYSWSVETNGSPLLAAESEPAGFVVVSEAQQGEIAKALAAHAGDDYDAMMARAQVLVDNRLWYDAIAAYSELAAKFPDTAAVYEARGNVYAQLAATKKLSAADFAQADKLKASTRK
jgi:hypothetical protein